jgi:polyisoprenoid-binding protein YceI
MSATRRRLEVTNSSMSFSVRHMVVSKVRGRFAKFERTMSPDDGDLSPSVVEASIEASSLDTGTPERDSHLRSPDFFDVEMFSDVRFP